MLVSLFGRCAEGRNCQTRLVPEMLRVGREPALRSTLAMGAQSAVRLAQAHVTKCHLRVADTARDVNYMKKQVVGHCGRRRIMIARDGVPILLITLLVSVITTAVTLSISPAIGATILISSLIVLCFEVFFFRDPNRMPPVPIESAILSPADGQVIEVGRISEPLYIKGDALRIAIFLSLCDVHVNRCPCSGTVEFLEYHAGRFHLAYLPTASTENEQAVIGVLLDTREKVVFKQIAGSIARRIRHTLILHERIRAGDRFGIIMFGSRLEVFIPLYYSVVVQIGQKVRAGESILALLSSDSDIQKSSVIVDAIQDRTDRETQGPV
jgi:phosphatidylserine decarboxylase